MHHRFDYRVPLECFDVRHHTKVEVAELALTRRQQITRMGVRMEETVVEHLPEAALDQDIDEFRGLPPADFPDRCRVDQAHAFDPLHGQNSRAAQVRVDFGDVNVGYLCVKVAEKLCVGGLGGVVDLAIDELAEIVDHAHQVDLSAQLLEQPRQQPGVPAHDVQVDRDDLFAAGPLDLDRHQIAIGDESAFEDLADGGRSDGLRLYELEDLVEGHAQLLADYLEGRLLGEGRKPVLKSLQFDQVLLGEEVGAAR
mmetsp:Transcript_66014/g.148981  ORF Transcript_66014/g.148981 Transcript_66014/m.148981 type:complete len:254 (+) Transcript_66014:1077-1838(+)